MRQIVIILLHLSHSLAGVTGGTFGNKERSADILEFTDVDSWSKLGVIRDARSFHGTSIIQFNDFERYCK